MLTLRRTVAPTIWRVCAQVANKSTIVDFNTIKHKSKVPLKSTASIEPIQTNKVVIDKNILELLERLSLCNLSDKEALQTLEESIEFASKILHIDTSNVEPLFFVHQDQSLVVRKDIITEKNSRDDVLKNAAETDDTCFIAPPGNIPVELEKKQFEVGGAEEDRLSRQTTEN